MNGACQCGAITFTTPTSKPKWIWHCHCTECQKQSGSAYGTSPFFPLFELDKENAAVGSFERTCDSGKKQRCFFCKQCGTRILHQPLPENGDSEVVAVRGGLLGKALNWGDAAHIWCKSAVVPIPEGVRRSEAAPDFKVPWY